ncbi:MAG: HlyD family secretion protein [Candidatus Binatia bacterium]
MPTRPEKKWLMAGAILAVAAIVALIAAVGLRRATTEPPAAFAAGKGRIEATEHAVAVKRAGSIEKFLVATGEMVEAGQPVAQMSIRDLETGLSQAEGELKQARDDRQRASAIVAQHESEINQALAGIARRENELAITARNLERLQSLFNKDLIARQEVDKEQAAKQTIEARLAVEKARRQTAEASLRAAEVQLDRQELSIQAATGKIQQLKTEIDESVLKSPVRGRVRRLAESGQRLPAGGKVITVLQLNEVYMTFLFPDSRAIDVTVGSEARVVLDGTPGEILPASVISVSPGAHQDKAMSRIKVKIHPEPLAKVDNIKTGSPGVVHLRLDSKRVWPDRLPTIDQE